MKNFVGLCDKIIEYSFYALFFLVPLVLTPFNYELFEYNKMMATYGLTVIIVGAWLIKMAAAKQIIFRRTPLDIPVVIFFVSQVLSFLFSIDPHVSLFGYYSRFHGGLLSTISYILLYYALVSNMDREKVLSLVKVSLLSGLVVATYGILEHFGIDKDIWVQDVQTRVFSTLGQPNWLAAYLAILIPIAMAFALNPKFEYRNSKQFSKLKFTNDKNSFKHSNFGHLNLFRASDFGFRILFFYLLSFIFYLTLLYTKSRSGFFGFWVVNLLFWTGLFILSFLDKITLRQWLRYFCPSDKKGVDKIRPWYYFVFKNFLIINSIFLILTFINGAPFSQINRFTAQELFQAKTPVFPSSKATGSALEIGGTESGEIRKIVWKGALDIARHYPLFGSGVETFAYSYYQFRPKEHNLVSEWDFLYNKAHNEYLNYAATTGLVGLGSYVLFITSFLFYFLKNLNPEFGYRNSKQFSKFKCPNDRNSFEHSDFDHLNLFRASDFGFRILFTGLFTGWLSILVTSFFGFSVVSIALFFWLIPAMTFVILSSISPGAATVPLPKWNQGYTWVNWKKVTTSLVLFAICYLLFTIFKFWYADTLFTQAFQLAKGDQHSQAYPLYHQAINLNPNEPFFRDELSYTASVLAVSAFEQNQATLSAQLVREAIEENKLALATSPFNVNFWKTRTKIFYTLSVIDDKYNEEALEGLLTAQKLAPTDAKISYNLGLLYGRVGNPEMAIKTLKGTIELKPNYGDARYALALYYKEKGELNEAIDQLEYILTKISTEDAETKARLGEWKKE